MLPRTCTLLSCSSLDYCSRDNLYNCTCRSRNLCYFPNRWAKCHQCLISQQLQVLPAPQMHLTLHVGQQLQSLYPGRWENTIAVTALHVSSYSNFSHSIHFFRGKLHHDPKCRPAQEATLCSVILNNLVCFFLIVVIFTSTVSRRKWKPCYRLYFGMDGGRNFCRGTCSVTILIMFFLSNNVFEQRV